MLCDLLVCNVARNVLNLKPLTMTLKLGYGHFSKLRIFFNLNKTLVHILNEKISISKYKK